MVVQDIVSTIKNKEKYIQEVIEETIKRHNEILTQKEEELRDKRKVFIETLKTEEKEKMKEIDMEAQKKYRDILSVESKKYLQKLDKYTSSKNEMVKYLVELFKSFNK